jgi:hypothetical protein
LRSTVLRPHLGERPASNDLMFTDSCQMVTSRRAAFLHSLALISLGRLRSLRPRQGIRWDIVDRSTAVRPLTLLYARLVDLVQRPIDHEVGAVSQPDGIAPITESSSSFS